LKELGGVEKEKDAKCGLHPLIHTLVEFNLAQYIVAFNASVISAANSHKQEKLHPQA